VHRRSLAVAGRRACRAAGGKPTRSQTHSQDLGRPPVALGLQPLNHPDHEGSSHCGGVAGRRETARPRGGGRCGLLFAGLMD
jgi:hypothetical protein